MKKYVSFYTKPRFNISPLSVKKQQLMMTDSPGLREWMKLIEKAKKET